MLIVYEVGSESVHSSFYLPNPCTLPPVHFSALRQVHFWELEPLALEGVRRSSPTRAMTFPTDPTEIGFPYPHCLYSGQPRHNSTLAVFCHTVLCITCDRLREFR